VKLNLIFFSKIVFYVPLGRWNVRDRINDGYLEEIYTFRITMLEYYIEKHIKMSKRDKLVIMFDLHELSFYKCAHMESKIKIIIL
jgi:aryl-phospho-beta-D-glucosidase BglC (GH1 family)